MLVAQINFLKYLKTSACFCRICKYYIIYWTWYNQDFAITSKDYLSKCERILITSYYDLTYKYTDSNREFLAEEQLPMMQATGDDPQHSQCTCFYLPCFHVHLCLPLVHTTRPHDVIRDSCSPLVEAWVLQRRRKGFFAALLMFTIYSVLHAHNEPRSNRYVKYNIHFLLYFCTSLQISLRSLKRSK